VSAVSLRARNCRGNWFLKTDVVCVEGAILTDMNGFGVSVAPVTRAKNLKRMTTLWIILGLIGYFLIGAVVAGIGIRKGLLDDGSYDDDAICIIILWPFALILGIVVLIVVVFGQIALWIAKK